MKNVTQAVSVVVALSFLVACGPRLRTNYSFLPPSTQHGKACVFQCDNSKLQCQRFQDSDSERCRERARYTYDLCEERNRYRNKDDREYCYKSYCARSNYSSCEESYRSCYQTCGGVVTSETVCVGNCEEYHQQQAVGGAPDGKY